MVMKQNCERLDRITSSTKQVKLLASCSKAFIASPTHSRPEAEPNFEAVPRSEEEQNWDVKLVYNIWRYNDVTSLHILDRVSRTSHSVRQAEVSLIFLTGNEGFKGGMTIIPKLGKLPLYLVVSDCLVFTDNDLCQSSGWCAGLACFKSRRFL